MFSKLLVKLVDQAIFPAIFLVSLRIISLLIISSKSSSTFTTSGLGFVYTNMDEFIYVSSYSLLFMLGGLAVGLMHILIKARVFHDTHITPSMAAKVFGLRLSSLIQGSFDLYSQGAIWLSYMFLLTAVCGIMNYFSMIYSWVFYISVSLLVVFFYIFAIDVEREIEASQRKVTR